MIFYVSINIFSPPKLLFYSFMSSIFRIFSRNSSKMGRRTAEHQCFSINIFKSLLLETFWPKDGQSKGFPCAHPFLLPVGKEMRRPIRGLQVAALPIKVRHWLGSGRFREGGPPRVRHWWRWGFMIAWFWR